MNARAPDSRPSRRGYTLVELVIASGSATFLLAGLGAAVMIATTAFRPETNTQHVRTSAAMVQRDLLTDLQLASGFSERTDKAATFLVPDRDGDGRAETIRYSWSGVSGAPLLFSFNGATAVPVLNDVRQLSLSYLTQAVAARPLPAEQTGSQILLLVNDSSSPTVDELEWKSQMEAWNFVVAMLGANNTPSERQVAIASSQAVFIHGDLSSGISTVGSEMAGVSIGVVNLHPDLVDEIGFAGGYQMLVTSNISVVNSSHYITQGTATGSQSVVNVSSEMARLNSSPATSLNRLATVSGDASLVTINPQKPLYGGGTAAGRRVMLPWGKSFDPSRLTPTGQNLTRQAIGWATGLGEAVDIELKKFGYDTIFTGVNGLKRIQYSTKANLPDRAMVKSITAYVGNKDDEVRFAIYADSNGQPGNLLVQSAVGMTSSSMAWVTLTVPDTQLEPGNYWLAFSFKNDDQKYRYSSSGGLGERNVAHRAVEEGYSTSWGTSSASYSGKRSIYATYEVVP